MGRFGRKRVDAARKKKGGERRVEGLERGREKKRKRVRTSRSSQPEKQLEGV